MTTYANQKIIHINKPVTFTGAYLSISNDEWMDAYKNLNPSTFGLYLYLCSNANGFDLALSQKAVENKLGMSKATYHRAVNDLEENGYLRLKKGNVYDFFINSLTDDTNENEIVSQMRQSSLMDDTNESHKRDKVVSPVSTEISNISKISNLSKELEEREERELREMLDWFRKGKDNPKQYGYIPMKKHFKIESDVNDSIGKIITDILAYRDNQKQLEVLKENVYIPIVNDDISYEDRFARKLANKRNKGA